MRIEVQQRNKNVRLKDIRIGGLFVAPGSIVVMMRTDANEDGENCVCLNNGILDSFSILTDVIALEQVEPLKLREV